MISAVTRHVAFFVYPDFVLLDLSGPMEAFAIANKIAPGSYRMSVMSLEAGEIGSSVGLGVMTERADTEAIDTFIVAGDYDIAGRAIPSEMIAFVQAASAATRRTASVCTGAFLLAASGILDGRKATTHWRFAPRLQAMYPGIRVDGDRIFLEDGDVWTSAGMTAGIDMTLALIEQDLGSDIARAIARMLVVYYRRPGGQLQHSSLLELDPGSDRIRRALSFAREHLSDPLPVERLADVANLSLRQFGRAFVEATGMPPAKAVERLRAEAARSRVEDSREPLETIAQSVGFADPERMRQSFIRVFGQPPRMMRRQARLDDGSKQETPRP